MSARTRYEPRRSRKTTRLPDGAEFTWKDSQKTPFPSPSATSKTTFLEPNIRVLPCVENLFGRAWKRPVGSPVQNCTRDAGTPVRQRSRSGIVHSAVAPDSGPKSFP